MSAVSAMSVVASAARGDCATTHGSWSLTEGSAHLESNNCSSLRQYRWDASASCAAPLPEYSAEELCALAARRATATANGVLIIGDSVSKHWFYWLRNVAEFHSESRPTPACRIVHAHTYDLLSPKGLANGTCNTQWWNCPPKAASYGCDGKSGVRVPAANVSADGTHLLHRHICFAPSECWMREGWLSTFSVIVANTGAHYVPLDPYYLHRLRSLQSFVQRAAVPGAVLIWRNMVPGHSGCDHVESRAPHPSLAAAERALERKPWYHGGQFQAFNRAAEERLVRNTTQPQPWLLLDVYTSTALRRDGHPGWHKGVLDCLHYCKASDVWLHWSRLLIAVLRTAVGAAGDRATARPPADHEPTTSP